MIAPHCEENKASNGVLQFNSVIFSWSSHWITAHPVTGRPERMRGKALQKPHRFPRGIPGATAHR